MRPPDLGRPASFWSSDPDELAERLAHMVPGVQVVATTCRFVNRTLAWSLNRTAVLSYVGSDGGAGFPCDGSYVSVSVPLFGPLFAGPRNRMEPVATGSLCVHSASEEGWIWNSDGAHVLGLKVEAALFDAYCEESGHALARGPSGAIVSTTTPEGREFLETLNWVRCQLVDPGSPIHRPGFAREVEDTLVTRLARACAPDLPTNAVAGETVVRQAEELLSSRLDQPMSLLEAATTLGASVRTLSRTFQRKRGISPMAFRNRQRLEATCRDLLLAQPGETSVTEVAMRYGFTHLGRFAGDYGRAFGECPSDTLQD